MNLIRNFFHAFGDIIFGLVVVSIAVFLIGSQLYTDFDVIGMANDAYAKVVSIVTGENEENITPILDNPNEDPELANTTENTEATNEEATNEEGNNNPLKVKDGEPSEAAESSKVPEIRNIVINPNTSNEEIASALFANGIIPSKEDFLAEIAKFPAGRAISAGKYQIPTGSTITQILDIIAPAQ